MALNKKKLTLTKKIFFVVSLSFVFIQINPHMVVLAKENTFNYGRGPVEIVLNNINKQIKQTTPLKKIISNLPTNKDKAYYTTYITATAYTSRKAETDSSPYIAAWGDHVFWGMLASNNFPKGTKIQIPDYFGDKMFIVLDRMNSRYYHRLDIWMPKLSQAKKWGARYIKIKVFK